MVRTLLAAALGDTPPLDLPEIQAQYDAERRALAAEIEALRQQAPDPNSVEGMLDFEADLEWEMTSLKFDVPEVSMNTRSFALHLPQVSMRRVSISWDNPEVHMEMKTIGKYPCFKGWKWYSCDIKTKMPQLRMVRREAKFDVPDVSWDRTDFSLDIPEFRMKRIEIKLHLPQVSGGSVSGEVTAYETRMEALAEKGEDLAAREVAATIAVVVEDLVDKRDDADRQFAAAITQLKAAAATLEERGIDPAKAASGDGTIDLLAQLAELRDRRDATLARLDAKIAELRLQTAG